MHKRCLIAGVCLLLCTACHRRPAPLPVQIDLSTPQQSYQSLQQLMLAERSDDLTLVTSPQVAKVIQIVADDLYSGSLSKMVRDWMNVGEFSWVEASSGTVGVVYSTCPRRHRQCLVYRFCENRRGMEGPGFCGWPLAPQSIGVLWVSRKCGAW